MNNDLTDITKVSTVAGGSWLWLSSGLPWGDITIIGGAIYIILKIILILPDIKDKYFEKNTDE